MNTLHASRKLLLCLLIVGLCLFGPEQGMGQPPSSRTDYLGDPLPEGAILRLGTARLRHPGAIRRLLFTEDGKSLIAVGFQEMPTAWEVETGKRIKTDATEFELLDKATGKSILVRTNPALWSSAAFGREGKTLLAVSYDHVVTAWDIESGKETSKEDKELDGALPDERSITKSALVRFLDPLTGEEKQKSLRLSYSWINWKTWSLAEDGKHLSVQYWSAGEMREIDTSKKSATATGGVFDLQARIDIPEKKWAVVSGWETVAGKNLEKDKFIWTKLVALPSETGIRSYKTSRIECLALSPDGKVVAAGTDSGHIELLDVATGERVGGSRSHPGFFSGPVQFVPGGKFVIVTMGREAVVWSLSEGRKVRGLGVDSEIFVSPNGQSLLVSEWSGEASKMVLQDTLSGKKLGKLDDRNEVFPNAQFSTDGETLAIYSRREPRQKQSVTYVSAKTGEQIRTFQPPDLEPPTDKKFPPDLLIKVSPEMTVATETSDRQRIELWNPPAAKELWTWTMPADCREHLEAVHFVPGGKYVLAEMASRTDIKEGLFVLDAKTGKQLEAIQGKRLEDISSDGRFIAYHVSEGKSAYFCVVRDLQSGEAALKVEGVVHGRFSADIKIFAYDSGNSIEFYDLQSKQRLGPPRPHPAYFLEMTSAPSGSVLAVHYNDSTVILWDAQAPSR